MAKNTNKYGLSRDIPQSIARQVRQECGFGCVICGASIIQYEHFNPDFYNAKVHDPAGIALLCGGCHDKVTRKFCSKETVANARANPFCMRQGFSRDNMDISTSPVVRLCGMTFENCQNLIVIKGTPILQLREPERVGAPSRLSAVFTNSAGESILQITDNEWRASNSNWDVRCEGGRIEILERERHYCLRLQMYPPNRVEIDQIRMRFGPYFLRGDGAVLDVYRPEGLFARFENFSFKNAASGTAISLN